MKLRNLVLLALATPLLAAPTATSAPYEPIGPLGAAPDGISADGSTIVGTHNGHAFRWTDASGYQNIGGSQGTGVNGDGSVIAATVFDQGLEHAAIWTEAGGFELLDDIPGAQSCDAFFSSSWGMSDGAVIVGLAWVANCRAHGFRWEEGTGAIDLGTSVPNNNTRANAVSGDGQVVVGWQAGTAGDWQGAMWIDSVQTLLWDTDGLDDIPAGSAEAANFDGSVIVGGGAADGGAWRWTGGTHVESIGVMPGFSDRTYALDVSDDGSVIVGTGAAGFARDAFIWTEETGMVELGAYLVSIGINDAVGTDLGTATGVSADGRIIVGWGYQADLSIRGWRVNLNEAPAAVDSASPTASFQIVSSYPNPFQGSTEVSYSLDRDEATTLAVYDSAGRQVQKLFGGLARAGSHSVEWNGRDSRDVEVPAGTYFVRMEAGSESVVRKLTVVR